MSRNVASFAVILTSSVCENLFSMRLQWPRDHENPTDVFFGDRFFTLTTQNIVRADTWPSDDTPLASLLYFWKRLIKIQSVVNLPPI